MRFSRATLLAFLGAALAAPAPPESSNPPCRFALDWSQDDILAKTDDFIWDMLYWEGKFHQNDIAYNQANGMTYDGAQIDWTTGEATKKHIFSAASKEVKTCPLILHDIDAVLTNGKALQIMLYARAIDGSAEAARFLSPDKPDDAPGLVFDIMQKKLDTYLRFNETYPGFGGALPWFTADKKDIAPNEGWDNRVPALDNG